MVFLNVLADTPNEADKSAIVLAIVNPTLKEQQISFDYGNTTFYNKVRKWTIKGTSVDAINVSIFPVLVGSAFAAAEVAAFLY